MLTKISLKYGAISGLFIGCTMLTLFLLGFETRGNSFVTVLNLLVTFSGSFLPIYMVRRALGGEIVFKSAIRYGLSGAFMMAVVFAIITAIYYNFVNPNFATKYLVDIEISMKHNGATVEEINKELAQWREDMSATNQTLKVFMSFSIIGAILTLINALILCKKD